jgi:pyridoxine kinase
MTSLIRRVLSIQSHVVHGFVGNKAATFPMQCLGIDVDAINTVTLSNRPDYPQKAKGFRLEPDQFENIIEGLHANGLVEYDAILSGYISSTEIIEVLYKSLLSMRKIKPDLMYVCDPVLGDNGKFYVAETLLNEYKTKLLPLATVITPNFFEAQVLSGITITSLTSAIDACHSLHLTGPRIVCLKGIPLSSDKLCMLISEKFSDGHILVHRIDSDTLAGTFAGCGDLFAALVTSSLVNNPSIEIGDVLNFVSKTMNDVLSLTKECNSLELKIIESIDSYRTISTYTPQQRSYIAYGPIAGIIFDLDGTLTLPGAIDFASLYARLALGPSADYDIIKEVNGIADEKIRAEKWAIIVDEEAKAELRMELQPDAVNILSCLRKHRIRVSIATRNNKSGVHAFIKKCGLEEHSLSPVITRDCLDGINKPDPSVANHILSGWDILQADQVWFFGDSIDDMKCGKGAGCKTCLLINPRNAKFPEDFPELIDMAVHSLEEAMVRLKLM